MNEFNNKTNPNLIILFKKIFSDEKLANSFASCENIIEFYCFCTGIVQGYTMKELHDFLINLASLTFCSENDKMLLEEDLEKVAGGKGMNDASKKYIASLLSALSLASFTPMSNLSVNAADDVYSDTAKEQSINAYKAARKYNLKNSQDETSLTKTDKLVLGIGASAIGAAIIAVIGYDIHCRRSGRGGLSISSTPDPGGLPNFGNSCYLNALIQQLYSITAFKNAVMNDTSGDLKAKALRDIFTQLDTNKPVNRAVIERAVEELRGEDKAQQDAGEFLIKGLDTLLSRYGLVNNTLFTKPINLKEVPNDTEIANVIEHGGDLNRGKLTKYLKEDFLGVNDDSVSDENINRIYNVISGRKLSNKPSKQGEKSEQQLADEAINALPEKSKLRIKRYQVKDDIEFDFNDPLEIHPNNGQFCVVLNRTGSHNLKVTKPVQVSERLNVNSVDYQLTGVVIHRGGGSVYGGESIHGGHYYSYKRDVNGGQWKEYNDSAVSDVIFDQVKADSKSNGVMFTYTQVQ